MQATTSIRRNTRVVTRSKAKSSVSAGSLSIFALGFLFIASITFGLSTLIGQTLMENARRQGIRAIERSREAKMDLSRIRQRVDRLSNAMAIDEWAKLRGMVLPYQQFEGNLNQYHASNGSQPIH